MPTTALAKLLIVDDEAAQMKALCDTLRDHGYETVGFTTGTAALVAVREAEFDLLLADLMMPEMDGIALLRAAQEVDPTLVGIIMTGQGTITTAVEAMKTGALDYILKPFKLSVMLLVLSRALAVRRLRRENAELAQRVRERTAELEAANKELEAFSFSVSHDLRAPLRGVSAFAHILARDYASQMPTEAQRLLSRVTTNAQRMEQLIEDLLRFSRLGRQPLAKQPVNIAALVHEVLQDLGKDQGDRHIEVKVGDLPDGIGDPSLLEQVFVNLLANAFKFTRQKERAVVEVGCQQHEGERIYFVRDNGAGFDMRYAEKLFGVFQRFHSVREFEGTGVGLSIVQRIIQRHGGRIWADAAVDQGATFYFSLRG
jgi:two-component system sensor histidine kinase/response regulator